MASSHLRILLGAIAIAGMTACDREPTAPTGSPTALNPAVGQTGNGAPSGPHFNLNLIGVPKTKSADMTGDNGRRIFVGLGRDGAAANTKILLYEGDFQVLDANGTDGTAAFQLPNPDPDGDGVTAYSVYVRALGKPGGKATMQSCYTDQQTGETWCAVDYAGGVEPILLERKAGRSKFDNVSKDLLYVDVCISYDATTQTCLAWDQLPLFSDELDQYFWSFDNQGLKLAQLRFYEIPTTTPW
jgi:hypothetical protein